MSKSQIASCLVISGALAAGCGDGSSGSLTLAEFGERSPMVTCSVLEDCYGRELLDIFLADCEGQYAALFEEAAEPRYQQAIADGSLIYHGDQAQACLDAVEAAGCANVDRAANPACEAVFEGTLASGAACSINEQCMGDAFCQTAPMSCGGTCQARVASGAACAADEDCQAGLRCFDMVCRAPAGAGAPCQGDTGVECAGGLVCLGQMMGMPGECASPASVQTEALGASCDPIAGMPLCMQGLSCALTSVTGTTPNFVCVDTVGSGGACHVSFPEMCPSGEACDANPFSMGGSFDGTCRPLPTDLEPCAPQDRCAPGHVCDGTTCHAIRHVGGACLANEQCYSGLCEDGTCVEGALCE